MKRINRFWDLKKYIEFNKISDISIGNEVTHPRDRGAGNVNGYYEIFNNTLIAIFSVDQKNYLLFIDQLVELTNAITIKYDIAQEMNKISWFEIYNEGQVIFKIEYVNPHEPLMSPPGFPYDEDYFYTNFGNKLAEYIEKVHVDSEFILFPGV